MRDPDPPPAARGEPPPPPAATPTGVAPPASPPQPPPQDDPMGPPAEPCECWCMHCHRTFMSDAIWFQRVVGDPDGFAGFWMCPTPNCDGAGFTFDIFPTDPDHPANEGWSFDDDEEADEGDGEGDEEFLDEDEDGIEERGITGGGDDDDAKNADDGGEWDPDESKWKQLDAELGVPDDDDVEGDEWKHGLDPGERPPPRAPASWPQEERQEWEAQQRSYDEPDRRPRELDWSDRPPRPRPKPGEITEDDIPV